LSVNCGRDQGVGERQPGAALAFVIATAVALTAPEYLASAPRPGASGSGGGSRTEPRKPVLVVVITSDDPAFRAREQNLATQLELALDGFAIERYSPDRAQLAAASPIGEPSFASLSLPKKLAFVQPVASRVGAVAVIWMEDGGNGAAFLHVASQSVDRAFVRIVRARGGPNTEEELAFAAQELLGQVYMLSTPSKQKPVEEAVERVMDEARSLRLPSLDWGVLPFLETGGGIYGHAGSSFRFGGGIAAEAIVGERFFARLSVAGLAGPFMEPRDGVVSGWSIGPGLKLGLSWEVSDLARLGFAVGANPVYLTAYMSLGEGDHQASDWWNFHGTAGADLRVSLGDRVTVVVEPSLGFWTIRKSFYRLSDDSVIFRTPFIDWNISAGVLIWLW
jgi:hypothetical protein